MTSDLNPELSRNTNVREDQSPAEFVHMGAYRSLAYFCHDFRAPLHSILGFTRILLLDPDIESRHEELAIVLQSAEHLLGLTNNIIDLSGLELGGVTISATRFDLHPLLDALLKRFSLAAREKNIALVSDWPFQGGTFVCGDPMRLEQVLGNLLENAIKFTDCGQVRLSVAPTEGRLSFTVTDTGVGFDPCELQNSSNPVMNTDRRGRGSSQSSRLGLAICRKLVRLMGGELTIRSRPAHGTEAHFALQMPIADIEGSPSARVLVLSNRTEGIFVEGESTGEQTPLSKWLFDHGFSACIASEINEALAQCHRWRPHTMIIDMEMGLPEDALAGMLEQFNHSGLQCILGIALHARDRQREILSATGIDVILKDRLAGNTLAPLIRRYSRPQRPESSMTATIRISDKFDCRQIPTELRERLIIALRQLNVPTIESHLKELRQHNSAHCEVLFRLARVYNYKRMESLLKNQV
jgi:hypothetical protein